MSLKFARKQGFKLKKIERSNLLIEYHCGDHKRTQQGVPNILLPYLYYRYMVLANNK